VDVRYRLCFKACWRTTATPAEQAVDVVLEKLENNNSAVKHSNLDRKTLIVCVIVTDVLCDENRIVRLPSVFFRLEYNDLLWFSTVFHELNQIHTVETWLSVKFCYTSPVGVSCIINRICHIVFIYGMHIHVVLIIHLFIKKAGDSYEKKTKITTLFK